MLKGGMVLSIKTLDFVKAAEAYGASKFRVIVKHVLPQTLSYIIVAITLSVPSYILAESGLSFLGLGIQQPDASWGNMLKEAQEYKEYNDAAKDVSSSFSEIQKNDFETYRIIVTKNKLYDTITTSPSGEKLTTEDLNHAADENTKKFEFVD